MIPFNTPPYVGTEEKYIEEAIRNHRISGDGDFTKRCNSWLESRFKAKKALLTTSGSTALDMAALLCGLKPGDEVVLPSFTFTSTATAFVLAGARLVFVDIRPDTMNLDEKLIEDAITERTRVLIPVHYAGVSCEMNTILEIASRHGLRVVEDAAQGVMSSYFGKALGTVGDFGCYSFHETKNYSMGEGGAILVNDTACSERAEILREKGTNRTKYFRGQVDKYTWVDIGDSYLPSELNAAHLWAQLEQADRINEARMRLWNLYHAAFQPAEQSGRIQRPTVPEGCVHNAHMYYLKLKDLDDRGNFIQYMKEHDILCVFHYVPLHSSPAGLRFGRFHGEDRFTTSESERLVRLPLYYGMTQTEQERVIETALDYLKK
ncbi:MAG: dTDP-4-amino-4,6-dideoxygalactose transaminase [Oscillospiraceae bacterium]|nr:dTDP-4-amino-4,6-dideoxygalactose transaminase [Oscillospiraceae bacterium]